MIVVKVGLLVLGLLGGMSVATQWVAHQLAFHSRTRAADAPCRHPCPLLAHPLSRSESSVCIEPLQRCSGMATSS